MNYDKILSDILIDNINYKDRVKGSLITKIKHKYSNILKYIENRYTDSLSLNESIKRMYYNIEVHPICPICGKLVKYAGYYNKMFFDYCSNKCFRKSTLWKEKVKQTCIDKYGVENPMLVDKFKEKLKNTCLEKYGVTNGGGSKQSIEKIKATLKERYGVEHIYKLEYFKYKYKQTCLKKYGVTNSFASKEVVEKIKQTCLEKYGNTNITRTKHYKQNNIKKYGVENPMQCESVKLKQIESKRKNHTFNTSSTEEKTYLILKEKYPDIIRQYHSREYPFACDFYIPSKDLYIECNYHWTHGGHPYNKKNDREKLEYWKSKGTKYYNNAIHTWTVLDVKKRQIVKENNLNYIEVWNINEIKNI